MTCHVLGLPVKCVLTPCYYMQQHYLKRLQGSVACMLLTFSYQKAHPMSLDCYCISPQLTAVALHSSQDSGSPVLPGIRLHNSQAFGSPVLPGIRLHSSQDSGSPVLPIVSCPDPSRFFRKASGHETKSSQE